MSGFDNKIYSISAEIVKLSSEHVTFKNEMLSRVDNKISGVVMDIRACNKTDYDNLAAKVDQVKTDLSGHVNKELIKLQDSFVNNLIVIKSEVAEVHSQIDEMGQRLQECERELQSAVSGMDEKSGWMCPKH
jgi:iron-sulfur cluster repair protein YtfE (RIC family)